MTSKFVEGIGLVPKELTDAAKEHYYRGPNELLGDQTIGDVKRNSFIAGGLKGMEIQKEIDAPKFKTLEEFGWTVEFAASDGGTVSVGVNLPLGYYIVTSHVDGSFTWNFLKIGRGKPCDSVEHGKQLAQKDYEEKCKSLLK